MREQTSLQRITLRLGSLARRQPHSDVLAPVASFRRSLSLALGNWAGLYQSEHRYEEALFITRQALNAAQNANAPDVRLALSRPRGKYKKGYQTIRFGRYSRYVGGAAAMAQVIRGEADAVLGVS